MSKTVDSAEKTFCETILAGLPIKQFTGMKKKGSGYDFVFSRDLTPSEQKEAKRIANKNMGRKHRFVK
jgi:hypothetical protein